MTAIEIEGTTLNLDLENSLMEDKSLREILAPWFPAAANATFERTNYVDGKPTVIKVIKRAGSNGNPCQLLIEAPSAVNPAISLAWQMKYQELQEGFPNFCIRHCQSIQTAIEEGRKWNTDTRIALDFLKSANASPSKTPVRGI